MGFQGLLITQHVGQEILNYTTTYPYISSSYSFNSPGSLYFYATTTYYSYAISPQFDAAIDLSTLQITFQALKNSTTTTYGRLDVGIMSDPADLTSFTVIRSITSTDYPATLTWYEFEVPLNTYTGTGNYIAFRSPNEGTSYLYLDNVVVNTIPNCIKPIQVIVSNLGQQSCDVRWTPRGNETSWDVVCVRTVTIPQREHLQPYMIPQPLFPVLLQIHNMMFSFVLIVALK
jgi:hypothetical protein